MRVNKKFRLASVSAAICATLLGTADGQQPAPTTGPGAATPTALPTPSPLPPNNSSATIRVPAPLGAPPSNNIQLPPAQPPAAANPIAQLMQLPIEQRKAEAARMVAQGRAALDRGDGLFAQQMALQAEALQIPESAWEPGAFRPWQLRLDADKIIRDQSNRIQQAGGFPQGAMPGGVMQAGMAAGPDGSRVQPAAAVQAAQPAPVTSAPPLAAVGSGEGESLYRRGLESLQAGRRDEAIQLFTEAWRYEASLPVEIRRQLKEKLTMLRPTQLPPPSGLADPLRNNNLQSSLVRQKIYSDVTRELAAITEIRTSDPMVALDRIKRLRGDVLNSDVEAVGKQQLLSMVDRALDQQQSYVDQHKSIIDQDIQNTQIKKEIAQDLAMRRETDQKISELVNQFNSLMAEERYAEAEVLAKQVQELDPKSPIATLMFHKSRISVREQELNRINADKEQAVYDTLANVERSSVPFNDALPMTYGDAKSWEQISRMRRPNDDNSRLGPREKEIERKLSTQVDVKFRNSPLSNVLENLSRIAEIPIVIDDRALSELRITRDQPITVELNSQISLRAALQHILRPLDLTYVIRNEVMEITNRDAQRANTYPVTYRVADLVIPIPNFGVDHDLGLTGALRSAYSMSSHRLVANTQPVSLTGLKSNQMDAELNPAALAQISPPGRSPAGGGGFPFGGPLGGSSPLGSGGAAQADFDSLMELIRTTIEPDTWVDNGGQSRMQPYAGNLSLVVSTTSDVHEQIKELLESLRQLQNLQVTIEVRFISLADNFFERLGVDFDFQIDDNVNRIPAEDDGSSVSFGITQAGLPTADFDVRVDNNLFGVTPQFGGFTAGTATSVGFAILSDIEAFFFLEALQGDTRTNVLQAPKVTMFDGQQAIISDTVSRPFVTSVIPVVGDFAVAQQPVIVVLNEGTQLHVQAVISDDRRFVRLTLVPFFSQINEVNTFTFEGTTRSTSRRRQREDTNNDGVVNEQDQRVDNDEETVRTGTTIQLPTFAQTSVFTTVSVPDGGTILLGGIKRMQEGRTERGVPILSKIPYVNRLFRNVAIGRTAQSLMLMVTPRIIIQEEEELAQTGFDPTK